MVIGCAQKAENENKHSWSFKILNHSMKINNGKFNCDFPSAFGCDIGIGEQLLFTKPNNILFKPFDILITHIRMSGKFWKTLFSIVSSLFIACLSVCGHFSIKISIIFKQHFYQPPSGQVLQRFGFFFFLSSNFCFFSHDIFIFLL